MAIIIPKVFTSEYSPEARKNLGFRGGNHDAFLKVAEAAIRANVIAKDSIANRWAKAADDEQAMDRIAQTVYGASSTALASLPVVKFDPEGKCFTIGGRQVGVDRCDMNKLYLGLVSVDGTALALVDDDEFDNIQTAMKGTPVADAMNAVEDRNHVLERKLDIAQRVYTNVEHDENGNERIPFITSLRKKSRENRTGFVADGTVSTTKCNADNPKYLPLIFQRDAAHYRGNIDKLMTCMFGIQGSASPNGPCYIYGHKPMLTGSTGKGTAGTDHHDVLSTVKNVKPETPVFSDGKDITVRNSLIAKIMDTSSYVPVRDIGDDVKFAANTYSITITKDEMKYLCAILHNICCNPEIDVNKKQEDKTKGQGDEHHQNTGSAFDSRQTNAVLNRAKDTADKQKQDAMNELNSDSDATGEFETYMSTHIDEAMSAISNVARNIGNLDANASLASDRFFTKELREIAGSGFRTEMDVSGAMSKEQEVAYLVAGVVKALITNTSSNGLSFFDASKVKVEEHDGIWFISDFGLLPQYEDMYIDYQSRAVLEDDTPFEIEDDFITLLLREMYHPNRITTDIRYLVHMEQDIGKIARDVKSNTDASNIQNTDTQLNDVISKVIPQQLAEKNSNKPGYVPTDKAIWNTLKKQPVVNIENLFKQINSLAPALGPDILKVLAVDVMANAYPTAASRYGKLGGKGFRGLLLTNVIDGDEQSYGKAFAAVDEYELDSDPSFNGNPKLLGMIFESMLAGSTVQTSASISMLEQLAASFDGSNTVDPIGDLVLEDGQNAITMIKSIPITKLAVEVIKYALTGATERLDNEDDIYQISSENHIDDERSQKLVSNMVSGLERTLKIQLINELKPYAAISPEQANELSKQIKSASGFNNLAGVSSSVLNHISKMAKAASDESSSRAITTSAGKVNSILLSIRSLGTVNQVGNYTVSLSNLDDVSIMGECGELTLPSQKNPSNVLADNSSNLMSKKDVMNKYNINISVKRSTYQYGRHIDQALAILSGSRTVKVSVINNIDSIPTLSSLFNKAVDTHDEQVVSDFVRKSATLTKGNNISKSGSRSDKSIVNFCFSPNPATGFDDTHTTLKVSNRLDTGISSDMARQLNPNTDEQHRLAQLMAGMDDDDTL